jgi:hypothetical protein
MKRTSRNIVADPDPGLFLPLDPGRKIFRIRDEHTRSFFREIRNVFRVNKYCTVHKFFEADPESFLPWIRNLFDPVSGINIPDPQHWQQDVRAC